MKTRACLFLALLVAAIVHAGLGFAADGAAAPGDPARSQGVEQTKAAVPTADEVLDERVKRVASELRCLVCQNQTIADSQADLAQDLRREVREMLAAGKSDDEVRAFMVARYGDFVLYRPPVKATTVLLWGGPFVLLLGGFWALTRIARARRRAAADSALSADEAQRLHALVAGRETGAG